MRRTTYTGMFVAAAFFILFELAGLTVWGQTSAPFAPAGLPVDTGTIIFASQKADINGGGITEYSLLGEMDQQIRPVITQTDLNKGLLLETKCLDGFILKITDKSTGYTADIDLHPGLKDYAALGIYNQQGQLVQDPMILVDGYGLLQPEDTDGDGVYELHGIQRISVGFHANQVGQAESVWTVRGGRLQLLTEKIEPLH